MKNLTKMVNDAFLPHPSQAKPNPKIPNPKIPNPNPGLGGFIITLNRRYRRRYRYRRRVLFEFSDFQYSNLNQI